MEENNFGPLNISVTKAVVNGSIYDIMTYEEYTKIKNSCPTNNVAIRYSKDGHNYVLPAKGKYNESTTTPGVYNAGPIDFIITPSESNQDQYTPLKEINISNKNSIKEILEKEEVISRMNEPWITSPDNITKFPICDDDQPEMKALKQALNAKKIDFDKYASRFGPNFPNDKRQLKNKSATLNIIKRFCDNCDLECEIVFRDKSSNVPNPLGNNVEIRALITDNILDSDD